MMIYMRSSVKTRVGWAERSDTHHYCHSGKYSVLQAQLKAPDLIVNVGDYRVYTAYRSKKGSQNLDFPSLVICRLLVLFCAISVYEGFACFS